jgi:hypothetical protein
MVLKIKIENYHSLLNPLFIKLLNFRLKEKTLRFKMSLSCLRDFGACCGTIGLFALTFIGIVWGCLGTGVGIKNLISDRAMIAASNGFKGICHVGTIDYPSMCDPNSDSDPCLGRSDTSFTVYYDMMINSTEGSTNCQWSQVISYSVMNPDNLGNGSPLDCWGTDFTTCDSTVVVYQIFKPTNLTLGFLISGPIFFLAFLLMIPIWVKICREDAKKSETV